MTAITSLLSNAKVAGIPKDQLENFLRAGYVPLPWQMHFHSACRAADVLGCPNEIGAGGARGPGKSHAMLAQIALDDCQRYPGLKALMLRKILVAGKRSFEDLRKTVLHRTPHKYNKSTGEVTFPNGSRVVLGHFKDDRSFEAQIGIEYDLIGVEEATTLESGKYQTIRTCQRSSKSGWRPRTYSNANPGNIGHVWYKRRFIQPWRAGTQGKTRFFPATYRDNPFLNEDYGDVLDELVGWQRRAWRDGDWDVMAGTYFTTFTKDHLIEPYSIDQRAGWTYYITADYGYAHPTAFILMAQDNNGDVIFVDDYSAAKRRPEAHHNKVLEMLERWDLGQHSIRAFVMGSDAWRPGEDGVAPIDAYKALGWRPETADMRRVPGAMEFLHRLGDVEAGIKPTLWMFKTCCGLVEQLPSMQHDKYRPEDVLKVNVDAEGYGGDDFYDAARYGLMLLAESQGLSFGTI